MKLLLGRKSSIWNSREKIILLLIQKVSLLTNNPHFACLGASRQFQGSCYLSCNHKNEKNKPNVTCVKGSQPPVTTLRVVQIFHLIVLLLWTIVQLDVLRAYQCYCLQIFKNDFLIYTLLLKQYGQFSLQMTSGSFQRLCLLIQIRHLQRAVFIMDHRPAESQNYHQSGQWQLNCLSFNRLHCRKACNSS